MSACEAEYFSHPRLSDIAVWVSITGTAAQARSGSEAEVEESPVLVFFYLNKGHCRLMLRHPLKCRTRKWSELLDHLVGKRLQIPGNADPNVFAVLRLTGRRYVVWTTDLGRGRVQ